MNKDITQKHKSISIRKNVVMNVLVTFSGIVNPLIVLPYVSRVLHPAGTGRVYFASSVISIFMLLAQMGIPVYGIRACARVRDDRGALSRTAASIMELQMLFSAGSYILILMTSAVIPISGSQRTLLTIMGLGVLFNGSNTDWLFQGLEEYPFLTGRSVFFKLASAALIILLTNGPEDYVIYGFLTMVPGIAASVYNLFFLKKKIDLDFREASGGLSHLRSSFRFFVLTAMTTVYTNLDMVMLGIMKGNVEAGCYGTAVKIKLGLVSLIISAVSVLMPRASYLAESGRTEEFQETIRRALALCLTFSAGASVLFSIFAGDSIHLLAGRDFQGAVAPMAVIMFTLVPIGVSQILGMEVLVPLGRENRVIGAAAAGAAADIIFNLFLIPDLGATGAAASTLISEVLVLAVLAWGIRMEKLDLMHDRKIFLSAAAGLVPAAAAGLLIHHLAGTAGVTGSFFLLISGAMPFVTIYGTVSYFIFRKEYRRRSS